MALGGDAVTTTVEGRERYTVNVRYPRDLRSDPQAIARDVLIAMPGGGTVPLGEVAKVELARGPTSIRTENGQLALYIFVDMHDRDLGGYVADAQKAVADNVHFPPGTYVQWSGQFEYLERATAKLKIVVPVTLLIIFLLLLPEFRAADRNADRHAVAAVRPRRRPVADVVARLQHVRRGRRRLHRAIRRRRRNRRRDADVSRSGAERDPASNGRPPAAPSRARTSTRRSCSARSSACGRK